MYLLLLYFFFYLHKLIYHLLEYVSECSAAIRYSSIIFPVAITFPVYYITILTYYVGKKGRESERERERKNVAWRSMVGSCVYRTGVCYLIFSWHLIEMKCRKTQTSQQGRRKCTFITCAQDFASISDSLTSAATGSYVIRLIARHLYGWHVH